ncbi:MraY family glycosyltransferase [Rhodococcus sp. X156]|uniref:glycosyltransferase family 4 protein n=1 Tax=Rhodococcus sp. X156 TaxID=2499145 RepID=UPI000FDBD235|nr:MraY family glycosyltransferase [Rhodococcus sp. X156]
MQRGETVALIAPGGTGVPIRELALVGLTAAVVTFLATGIIRVVAIRIGAVAYPRDRDVHVTPTPRLGGVGMYLGVLAAMLLAAQLPALTRGFDYSSDVTAVLWAGLVIVLVGAIDDRFGLDSLTKFAGQVTAAGVLVLLGLQWLQVYFPLGAGNNILVFDQLQSGLVTVGVTVLLVNAMNFVDGLDGLAAGIGLIAALAMCAFSLGLLDRSGGDVSNYPPALIAAVLAGVCLGFLPHNFEPARIFMGDSGSMLIGLMLAAVSTSASGKVSPIAYGGRDLVALLTPLLVVGAVSFVPVLDLLMAIVRRTRAGRSPFAPDKMHLHHRLLSLGHSHRRSVLLIYFWTGVIAFGAVATTIFDVRVVALVMVVGLAVALLGSAIPRLRDPRRRAEG